MNKLSILLYIIFQCAALSSFATSQFTMKSDSSFTVSDGRDGPVTTIENSTFSTTSLYDPTKKIFADGVLVQKVSTTTYSGREGADSKLEVNAWISGKNKYDTKLWSINDCAESGMKTNDFYQTTEYGCCGAENLSKAYDIETGKLLFSFTTVPVSVDISFLGNSPHQNSLKRQFAYVSSNGTTSACGKSVVPKRSIGVLTLLDGKRQIDKISLDSDDGELAWSPMLSVISKEDPKGAPHTLVMYKNSVNPAEAVKGFSIKALYYEGVEVIIPVTNDKFDIQQASLPKAIKLRRIAVDK